MEKIMDKSLQRRGGALAIAGFALAAAALANTVNAACTDPSWARPPSHTPKMLSAVYHPASDSAWAMTVSDESASIVGLWKIEMLSKRTATNPNPMPDGVLVDFGL